MNAWRGRLGQRRLHATRLRVEYHFLMRRLFAIALFAALPAAAQMHGVPPSVGSITAGNSTPGVAASVTSLGPNGFVDPMFRRPAIDPMLRNPAFGFSGGCCAVNFHFSFGRHPGPHHNFQHRRVVFVPYYYPYPVTYGSSGPTDYAAEEAEHAEYARDEDRYGEHYTDYRETKRRRAEEERRAAEEAQRQREEEARKAESKAATKPEEKPAEEPATVLIFRDGRRQEVHNYAISGDVLYDLAGGRAKKIQLADLNLTATIKENDQIGNDFRLPSRPPRQN